MADRLEQLPLEETFDSLYGLELLEMEETRATAQVLGRDTVRMPLGLVQGGVLASIAESVTSIATRDAARHT